jgi:uncharacterized repeat protein (TIGR01451 family)
VVLLVLSAVTLGVAQEPPVHYLHQGIMPPGAIGAVQLQRGGPLPGYFQPVEIRAPQGVRVSLAAGGDFAPAEPAPIRVGMLIGQVYRLRVTNIPLHEGEEVFPTVEVIDRLYPPRGQEVRFPIVLELTFDDLLLALDNKFVTRVVYLEDPRTALPTREHGQEWFEAPPGKDPLALADTLGRPMTIVRVGGRMPGRDTGPDPNFFFGCPPLVKFPPPPPAPAATPPAAPQQPPPATASAKAIAGAVTRQACPPVVPMGMDAGVPLPATASGPWTPPGMSQPWPEDEYLVDGGTHWRGVGAGRQGELTGLQPEDAVAQFDTLDGSTVVEPSNKVYLYSPRFGAVRLVVSLRMDEQRVNPVGVRLPTKASRQEEVQVAAADKQHYQPVGQIVEDKLTIYRGRQYAGATSQLLGPKSFQGAYAWFEDISVIRMGVYRESEMAFLARGAQAAIAWSHKQAVQVILDHQKATEQVSHQAAETLYTVNAEPAHPRLRLIKVASTQFANPGEEVDFTLRFDNVGNQPIGNVTIVDDLTGRLEYLAGTAQCSLPAGFITQPSESGSLVLRWEITNPLKPGDGGVVRFHCRVR